jgi:hypothetical protein
MKNKTFRITPQTFKSFTDLPFVQGRGYGKTYQESNWWIPRDIDYCDACRLGDIYAVFYMQYLLDNKDSVGGNFLSDIISDIDFSDSSGSKGVYVGFFSTIERFLYLSAKKGDMWGWLEKEISESLKFEKEMELEMIQKKHSGVKDSFVSVLNEYALCGSGKEKEVLS